MRTRRLASAALFGICLSRHAHAEEPSSALGVFTGAAVFVTGFGVGGVLLGTSGASDPAQDRAGWLTVQSGFTLAPLAAHAATGEWVRGMAFASPPLAMTVGTGLIFAVDPNAVRHGPLPEQRLLWAFFSLALASSAVGVVDAAFAGDRASRISVTPTVDRDGVGLTVGGKL